jgi:hypothetical protein
MTFRPLILAAVLASGALSGCDDEPVKTADVNLQIKARVYDWPDGGGYFLHGTGVTSPLMVNGHVVLPPTSQGSHCSGITLAVCCAVAGDLGLMDGWDKQKLRAFQKQWFGVDPASKRKQMAYAMEQAGIGREVKLEDVQPGDFIQFNIGKTMGHMAVVTGVIRLEGKLVGLNYRSSQPGTNGVGDRVLYFEDTIFAGHVRREDCTIARLGR